MKRTIVLAVIILALEGAVVGQKIFKTTCDNRFVDLAEAIVQTSDGGYLLAGKTYSGEVGHMAGLAIKYDASCNLMWKKEIGISEAREVEVYDATETPDKNILLAGRKIPMEKKSYDMYVCKLRTDGEILWEKTYGESESETGYKIIPVSGNDIMVVGTSNSNAEGRDKMLVSRIDGDGNLVWSRTYGEDQSNEAYSITELKNGGFVVVGTCSQCSGTFKNLTILRLDGSGNLLWNQTLQSSNLNVGFNVIEDTKGNIVVSGISKKKNKCRNYLMLAQFSPDGRVKWIKDFKMKGCVGITSIACSGNDNIFVGGTLFNFQNDFSTIFVMMFDLNGKTTWKKQVDGLGKETCNAMILSKEKSLVIAGATTDENMNTDILLVKTSILPLEK
jgi:hypothetical protein